VPVRKYALDRGHNPNIIVYYFVNTRETRYERTLIPSAVMFHYELYIYKRPGSINRLLSLIVCETGEQQSDINARIGQSAFLPCELEPNNVTMGFEVTTQCGIVHSVKWYRGASRIFLYSGGPRVVQPHREGYTDRYDR